MFGRTCLGLHYMKDDFSFEAQFGSATDQTSQGESGDAEQRRHEPDYNISLNTALLVIIAIVGLAILYHVTRLPEGHPYAKCQRIIGMDGACKAEVAASRMMRGF
ncbi:Putative membrane protein [Sphingopyxis fribergensis]|uniref:Putative membrane protein n=2 Tax=Sphingopyxis fribergensis TaxID=1515612 RepID=A0A0A7PJI1_9SPHN|nr:Putative membrane protein [Sphingopyxis fribergensis]